MYIEEVLWSEARQCFSALGTLNHYNSFFFFIYIYVDFLWRLLRLHYYQKDGWTREPGVWKGWLCSLGQCFFGRVHGKLKTQVSSCETSGSQWVKQVIELPILYLNVLPGCTLNRCHNLIHIFRAYTIPLMQICSTSVCILTFSCSIFLCSWLWKNNKTSVNFGACSLKAFLWWLEFSLIAWEVCSRRSQRPKFTVLFTEAESRPVFYISCRSAVGGSLSNMMSNKQGRVVNERGHL